MFRKSNNWFNPYIDPSTHKPWTAQALDRNPENPAYTTYIASKIADVVNDNLELDQEAICIGQVAGIFPFKPSEICRSLQQWGYWVPPMEVRWAVRYLGSNIDDGVDKDKDILERMRVVEKEQLTRMKTVDLADSETADMNEQLVRISEDEIETLRKRVKTDKAVRQMVEMNKYTGFSSEGFEKEIEELKKQDMEVEKRLWEIRKQVEELPLKISKRREELGKDAAITQGEWKQGVGEVDYDETFARNKAIWDWSR